MDTPPDSQRKAWARLSTLTSFVSRICFFKARCSDSDSVNGFIVIPPAFDFTRVRLGGVKKILSTYLLRSGGSRSGSRPPVECQAAAGQFCGRTDCPTAPGGVALRPGGQSPAG